MQPIIDHIQITVKDLKVAEKFYDKFLPIIGFDIKNKVSAFIEEHDFHVVEYTHKQLAFAITSPRQAFKNDTVHRRKSGALHHLAFKAESRAEVDQAYSELQRIGAVIVSGPQVHPEYGENYYAVYFKNMENMKYEIVCNCVIKKGFTIREALFLLIIRYSSKSRILQSNLCASDVF